MLSFYSKHSICLHIELKNFYFYEHVNFISDRTETEYVSQMLTMVKRFAQHHACHVWFVAHPRQVSIHELLVCCSVIPLSNFTIV